MCFESNEEGIKNTVKFNEICAKLKSEGLINEKAKSFVRTINERYIDRDSRKANYEAWLSNGDERGSGGVDGKNLQDSQRKGDGPLLTESNQIQSNNQNINQPTARVERIIPDIDEQLCK